jgi:hypothetical protein
MLKLMPKGISLKALRRISNSPIIKTCSVGFMSIEFKKAPALRNRELEWIEAGA